MAVFAITVIVVLHLGQANQVRAADIQGFLPSTWISVFEEAFGEDWDTTSLTAQLDASGWNHILEAESGYLQLTCNCWASIPLELTWTDFAFSSRVRVAHGGVTLSFRQCTEGRYFVGLEDGSLYLGKERPWGIRTTLATSSCRMSSAAWYDITMVGIGPDLSVYLDGQRVIRYEDTAVPLLSGGVSYETCGHEPDLRIDTIRIATAADSADAYDLFGNGDEAFSAQEYATALDAYERALQLFRTADNRSGEAETLHYIGVTQIELGEIDSAIATLLEAEGIAAEIGDLELTAWCNVGLGSAYMSAGSPSSALPYLEVAEATFVALSDEAGEIEALRAQGHCLLALADEFSATDPAETIFVVRRALTAFQAAQDEAGEANALLTLAYCYQAVSEYSEALFYARQAEFTYRSIHDWLGANWALLMRANCHLDVAEYDQAESLGTAALEQFQSLRDERGEAEALVSLSCVYEIRGRFQEAVDCCVTALDVFQELEAMDSVAMTLERLGTYYIQLGDVDRATEIFAQGLEIARTLDIPWILANALAGAADPFLVEGNAEAALPLLEEALNLFRELGSNSEADCLARLVDCSRIQGDFEQARAYAHEIIRIGEETDAPRIECNGLMTFGNIQLELGEREAGIDSLKASLDIAREIDARYMQVDLCRQLGNCYWADAHTEEARVLYREAIDLVEAVYSALTVESLQQSFFPRVREIYTEYMLLLLDTEEFADTLWIAERCRARTYVETVAQAASDLSDVVPNLDLHSGVLCASDVVRVGQEMIASLPEEVTVLEFFIVFDDVYVWVIRTGDISDPVLLATSREDLTEQVIACREAIESQDPAANLHLAALHDTLIAPIGDLLPASDGKGEVPHLIIVPSGPLYYLPFQALVSVSDDRQHHIRLIERYAVSYTPSIVTLSYAQANTCETDTDLLLALADPDSGDSSLDRLPDAQTESQRVAALFSTSEVYLDVNATETVVRSQSSLATDLLFSTHGCFDPVNPMYSYLLLSPTADSDGRLHTYEVFGLPLSADLVVLSACETLLPSIAQMEDEVRATRGMATDEPVELTREQLEELTMGDEISGLTRAFLYAGTSSVLSSLWSVYSQPTADLMVAFYEGIQAGASKAEALRNAQLQILNTPGYEHPVYWAAFNLMGDWRWE